MDITEINENMVFRLSSRRSPKEVKSLNLEWAVVTQLDGEKNVGQIAEILALSRKETSDIFQNLLKEGLLELNTVSAGELYVSENVFRDLEHELTVLLGPVAGILMQDTLRTMRKTRHQFEVHCLPIIIDLLSCQIDDSEKQLQFQKNIYQKIKSYVLGS